MDASQKQVKVLEQSHPYYRGRVSTIHHANTVQFIVVQVNIYQYTVGLIQHKDTVGFHSEFCTTLKARGLFGCAKSKIIRRLES
jgi:hypothetical protein